jgi:hypothetical protein
MKRNYVLLQGTDNLMMLPFPEEPIMSNAVILKALIPLTIEQAQYLHFIQFVFCTILMQLLCKSHVVLQYYLQCCHLTQCIRISKLNTLLMMKQYIKNKNKNSSL